MIRNYESADFDAVLQLLSTQMEYDTLNAALLREKLYADPQWNPQTTYVATEADRVVGFLQGVYRDVRGTRYGYIKLMAVHPQYRRRGLARSMYQRLEQQLHGLGTQAMRIYDVPLNYFMPGIDPRYTPAVCFAERMGFRRNGDTSNLRVELQNQDWSVHSELAQLAQHQIEVRRAVAADHPALYELLGTDWALWRYEVDRAMENNPPTLHLALLNGQVRAFAAHNANNKGTGWFGPMLTHDDLRGRGLGSVLLKLCLEDMQRDGLASAVIPWVGPIPFYAYHAQAEVHRVFWRYEKKLT